MVCLGHRGRGQAAQVPADVPGLRARRWSTRSTCCRTSTSTSTASTANLDAVNPGVRAMLVERPHRRGRRRVARLARAGGGTGARAACEHRIGRPRSRSGSRCARTPTRASSRPRPSGSRGCATGMAERFARGGRLLAVGATPVGALRRAPRRGRVRASRDRRQAGAAGARPRARGRAGRRAARAARRAGRHRRSASARRGRRSPARGERGCLTIAFARRGRRVGVRAADDDPFVAPGAGRDALPRAVGARARVLRAPRPLAARAGRRTTPARRASCIRSWAERETDLEAVVADVRRLRGDEGGGGRGAARADADRERATAAARPPRRCAPRSRAGGRRARARQRRLGDRRDGRRRRPARRRRRPRGRRSTSPRTRRS